MSFYIIIRGPLGSGKTTLSKKLAREVGGEYIGIDDILDENNLTEDKEDGYISQKSFIQANEIASIKAEQFLKKGIHVIFDGNFYWRSQIEDLTRRLEFPHHIFTLKVSLEPCIERDNKRKKPYGRDATEAVYTKSTEFDYGILIDASQAIGRILSEILKKINYGID